ncbi:hypothetical protein M153_10190003, partial [Pseudoloma neurophilia]
ECDASEFGICCSLRQDNQSMFHISRILKGAEKNYSITKKEL